VQVARGEFGATADEDGRGESDRGVAAAHAAGGA
jgi:hypothetical protein